MIGTRFFLLTLFLTAWAVLAPYVVSSLANAGPLGNVLLLNREVDKLVGPPVSSR